MSRERDAVLTVEGLPIELHRRQFPGRWLVVRSAWGQLGDALLMSVITCAVSLVTGASAGSTIAFAFGLLVHALVKAMNPSPITMAWHLDRRTPWLRFRAWWSR